MAVANFRDEVSRLVDTEQGSRRELFDSLAEPLQQAIHSLFEQGGETGLQLKDVLHGTWMGHPLHAALTDVPIGAWTAAVLLDLLGARRSADRAIAVGILAAVPTALAGAADWSETYDKPRRMGLMHAFMNTAALGLFGASLAARRSGSRGLGIALSTSGYAIAAVSAWIGGDLVYALGTGVSRNAFDPAVEEFQVAAHLADVPEGKLTAGEITVEGIRLPVVLVRRGGEVQALSGVCSHAGGPLAEGDLLEGDCVRCPWHGSVFQMGDGQVVHGPATMPQPRFETRVREGNVEVRRVG